ncbi:MAG: hypothetical protein LIP12_18120 [Clostridiales bacterium]|nr:hypothetical protein [Clostridiales bacterium]
MYQMEQIAVMDRNSLINLLENAEKCLLTVEQILNQKGSLEQQKTDLQAKCEEIRKKIKKFPFVPAIVVSVIMTLCYFPSVVVLAAVVAAAVLYKNKQYPVMETQIQEIQTQEIPSVESQIVKCDDYLNQLKEPAMVVKSLLCLMPENHRDLETIRGIKKELLRGAKDWYSALMGYEAVLAREEQQRQIREMQENVQQVAVNSERTAESVEEVRKHTEDIAKNTERTAAAAETAARNSARTADAAEKSAEANAWAAESAARQARAAESAAYWIYTSL